MNEDNAKEMDQLDCKSNPQHFKRLFRYLLSREARRRGISTESLCTLVPEAELRRVARKAVERFRPEHGSLTRYTTWWVRQGATQHAPHHAPFKLGINGDRK
jgi:hypothetical protein